MLTKYCLHCSHECSQAAMHYATLLCMEAESECALPVSAHDPMKRHWLPTCLTLNWSSRGWHHAQSTELQQVVRISLLKNIIYII